MRTLIMAAALIAASAGAAIAQDAERARPNSRSAGCEDEQETRDLWAYLKQFSADGNIRK
jgi:hypothetical protein